MEMLARPCFISPEFFSRDAIALFQFWRGPAAVAAICLAARVDHSAVADANADFPDAGRVAWSATRPLPARSVLSFSSFVRQPSHDGVLEISSVPVVCRRRGAEIHARPIPGRHRAQTKCFRALRWLPKTRVGLYPYPCVFLVDAPLLVYPGRHGSTIFLCASCCESARRARLPVACW